MFRICHVLGSVGEKGGLEKNVIELANKQAELGHEVYAIADETMREHFSDQVQFIDHEMAKSRKNPFNLDRLAKKIRATNVQIVHAHANKAAAMVRAIRNKLPGILRVATVQNIKSRVNMFQNFDAVITASAQVRDSLGGIPATVIWNSIEPPSPAIKQAAAASNPPWLGGNEPVFSTVGRLVPAKGMDLLLQAMAQVEGFKLWLVGEGLQRGELEQIIEENDLGGRVWMAGHRDDAVGLMGCSDLFVVASRNEGGPYTLAEALHMRVPCISTKVGFAPEFLPEKVLMETHSIDELVRGLRFALANLDKLTDELEPSFELMTREVTLDAMTRKVLNLYQSIVK